MASRCSFPVSWGRRGMPKARRGTGSGKMSSCAGACSWVSGWRSSGPTWAAGSEAAGTSGAPRRGREGAPSISSLDQLGSVFVGGLVGGLAGALIGSVALGRADVAGRVGVLAALACVAAAGMFAVAVWQVGAFTDADGPSGIRPYLGIALAPVSIVLVWLLVRWTRRPSDE
jgi:hypothetical protein